MAKRNVRGQAEQFSVTMKSVKDVYTPPPSERDKSENEGTSSPRIDGQGNTGQETSDSQISTKKSRNVLQAIA